MKKGKKGEKEEEEEISGLEVWLYSLFSALDGS